MSHARRQDLTGQVSATPRTAAQPHHARTVSNDWAVGPGAVATRWRRSLVRHDPLLTAATGAPHPA
ncbi:hypothetical protein ACTWP5_12435 [Streptomyces sp. 4N509B]|uniref:hypothetical protein n=1 Tax=Streptomyces sp. 4N509B TaxID=3457413 RepID=UPI003FD5B008